MKFFTNISLGLVGAAAVQLYFGHTNTALALVMGAVFALSVVQSVQVDSK